MEKIPLSPEVEQGLRELREQATRVPVRDVAPKVQRQVLGALQSPSAGGFYRRPKHVYGGTVPVDEIANRRRRNKAARRARRAGRRS